MDKYEYKLRLEEIKTLNKKGRFQEAAQVADTVDWNKVRNVSTLCVISDVYKINRRFEDAKAMLLMANEKSPQNRRISYALCDLTIKMGHVVEAVEYYKEFVQQAPNDNNRYILLYKIYEAQDISLEERIAVLKEYKKREYNEKWAYELAFLYHRVGLATECIEECDQLILWFGEGKYVLKAMELKQLYAALSPAQQQSYDRMTGRRTLPEVPQEEPVQEEETLPEEQMEMVEIPQEEELSAESEEDELDIQVKPMDMGEYNTINLQAALAESMREMLEPEIVPGETTRLPDVGMRQLFAQSEEKAAEQLKDYGGENAEYLEDVTRVIVNSEELTNGVTGQLEEEETERVLQQVAQHAAAEKTAKSDEELTAVFEPEINDEPEFIEEPESVEEPEAVQEKMDSVSWNEAAGSSSVMDNLLAQEYDGQISLALPEEKVVEKQITGQMNINDVLLEWERMKEANAKKRRAETREWMLQQTGSLFAEFDQQSREGVLEQLEREAAIYEERLRNIQAAKAAVVDGAKAAKQAKINAAEQEKMKTAEPEMTKAAEAFDEDAAEVEELEEIEEIQEEEWVPSANEAVNMDSEADEEAPRPANAAARAAMAAGSIAAAAIIENAEEQSEPVEEKQADEVQKAEEEAAGNTATAENTESIENTETASEEQSVSNEEESSEEGSQKEDLQREAAEQKENAGPNLEDTAALHARIREEQIQEHMRQMGREEKEMFAPFVPTRGAMRQLVTALDSISLSAFTGNVILTGAPGADTMGLARNMIRSVRGSNNNFSGKVAKISGEVLNEKSASEVVSKVAGGALLLEKAGKLTTAGAESLAAALNQEHTGVIVFAMDTKRAIGQLMERCPALAEQFTARFDIAALDSSTLVKYGCQYAYNQEFSIDELGRLALHTRIEDLQTSEHAVTVDEVREIIDEAIEHASRKSLRHFWDIIVRRRYDEEDMIILRERDFI